MITKLTQQQLQQILINIQTRGQESENISVVDIIEEIKQQMQTAMYKEIDT